MERGRYLSRRRAVCAALGALGLFIAIARGEEPEPGLLLAERATVLGFEALLPDGIHDARVLASSDSTLSFRPSSQRDGRPGVWAWRSGLDLYLAVDENFSEEDPATALGRPDSLEDVWLVDLESDGTLDRVCDWEDLDSDGLTDRQLLFSLTPSILSPDRLAGIVIEQRGPDRHFWNLHRLQYVQRVCQWKTDFSGEGFFVAVLYDDASGTWEGFDESPFCFFDLEGDGFSDEAVRLYIERRQVRSIRWSWDVDGDAGRTSASNPTGGPYDYDASISTNGRVTLTERDLAPLSLRNGETVGVVPADSVRAWTMRTRWKKAVLTWDEGDRNVDPEDPEGHERWEGVIGSAIPGYLQVGGPGSGLFGKRFELDSDGGGGLGLYVSGRDGKVHLVGAETGWIDWDDNGDGAPDRRLRMEDTDLDGYFDLWAWDRDGDGKDDLVRRFDDPKATLLEAAPEARLEGLRAAEKKRLGARTQAQVFAAERKAWDSGKPPLAP